MVTVNDMVTSNVTFTDSKDNPPLGGCSHYHWQVDSARPKRFVSVFSFITHPVELFEVLYRWSALYNAAALKNLPLTLSPATLGLASAIASALLFSVRPILVKLAYAEGVDPTSLLLLRMLFALPFYLLLFIAALRVFRLKTANHSRGLHWRLVLKIGLAGICGYYAASYFDLLGLQYVSAQLGRIILYLYPTLVVIGTAIYDRRPPSLSTLLSLLLAYTGVMIIFGHDLSEFGNDVSKGSFFIVLCAFCFAAYLSTSKPLIQNVGASLFTSIALIGASLAICLHYLALIGLSDDTLPAITSFSPKAYWLCLAIAIFSTVLPTFFTTFAIQSIGAGATSIASMVGPVFTSLLAVTILGEQFTVYHAAGMALIITGIAVLDRRA